MNRVGWAVFAVAMFSLGFWYQAQVDKAAKKPEAPAHRSHYKGQVRLGDEEVVRRVRSLVLGDRAVWLSRSAVKVDAERHLWIDRSAWAYPEKGQEGAWIEAELTMGPLCGGHAGFRLKMPRGFLGIPVADGDAPAYSDRMPVLGITYLDE